MSKDVLQVNEIYTSFQGEGVQVGEPTVFLRLQGCNIKCKWCDTAYSLRRGGKAMPLDDVVLELTSRMLYRKLGTSPRWVCITGGEPLVQEELVGRLVVDPRLSGKLEFEVFTNGTIRPPVWHHKVDSWVVDVKCPSTCVVQGTLLDRWLKVMTSKDALKFTVQTEEDLSFVEECLLNLVPSKRLPAILISPVLNNEWFEGDAVNIPDTGSSWLQQVANYAISRGLRYSLQAHKFVYGERRGV